MVRQETRLTAARKEEGPKRHTGQMAGSGGFCQGVDVRTGKKRGPHFFYRPRKQQWAKERLPSKC
ncbi:MAG: hypothetical protein CW346_12350 [Bacillaceae bacterium]|nr:hypothetical protein [Bacillaceae bacterium]